jgi:regulation of enolase protein 1 (concanavalin A-like superfamily)
MREFWRYYSFKVILGLVVLQLGFFSWLQYRNHRPEAITDEYSVYEGHSVSCMPLRNDSDKDDEDELTLQNVDSPIHGEIEIDENKLIYSAIVGFAGIDSFAYTIFDGKKESKKSFIKITVEENLKPTANNDSYQMYQGQEISIAMLANDEDREGDSLFLTEFTEPLHGVLIKEDNTLKYKVTNTAAKIDSFHYTISDGLNNSEQASVVVTIKSKSDASYPWLSVDIGNTAHNGGFTKSGDSHIVKASGSDIYGNSDNCHYAYQVAEGDCEIVAKVTDVENTHPWAKAGIMIRESLSASSKNAFIFVSAENGIVTQVRTNSGGNTDSPNRNSELRAPYWVKLQREGDVFTGYISPDGKRWTELASGSVPISDKAYIGLALTSHTNEQICTAQFNNVKIKL